jgi:hypothetical protein
MISIIPILFLSIFMSLLTLYGLACEVRDRSHKDSTFVLMIISSALWTIFYYLTHIN